MTRLACRAVTPSPCGCAGKSRCTSGYRIRRSQRTLHRAPLVRSRVEITETPPALPVVYSESSSRCRHQGRQTRDRRRASPKPRAPARIPLPLPSQPGINAPAVEGPLMALVIQCPSNPLRPNSDSPLRSFRHATTPRAKSKSVDCSYILSGSKNAPGNNLATINSSTIMLQ